MKYNYFLPVFFCFISTVVPSQAMNSEKNKLHHSEEITVVKNPGRVRYVGKDRIVVNTDNGCCLNLINLKTKEVWQLSDLCDYSASPSVSSIKYHNKKIIAAHHKRITIYNAQTGVCEWSANGGLYIRDFAYCPSKNTIFVCYGEGNRNVTKCDYVTGRSESIYMPKFCQLMTMHPKEEVMCIADCAGDGVSLHPIPLIGFRKDIFPMKSCYICQYSPDGSCIGCGDGNNMFIIDNSGKQLACLKSEENETFKAIAFHPHDSVLATLSCKTNWVPCFSAFGYYNTREQRVCFWDIKTQQLIDTLTFDAEDSYDLSFSEDGLEVVATLKDRCVRMLVPFAIKEKCVRLVWVLLQLKEQHNMPIDVVHYCGKILLESFKF